MKGHASPQLIATTSSRNLLFLTLLFTILIHQAYAQQSFLYRYCQNENGKNYTTNSTTNQEPFDFTTTMSISLPSSKNNTTSNFSLVQMHGEIYETGLCRGDIDPASCRSCLNHSAHLLAKACPNDKDAIGWFDLCMLRYSNRSSFGLVETLPRFHSWNAINVSSNKAHKFFRRLMALLDELKNRAALGGYIRKYSTGSTSVNNNNNVTGFETIYALVQCMPDLSIFGCMACLDDAFGDIERFFVRIGGRVVTPSCNFRYEVYLFYGIDAQFTAVSHSSLPPSEAKKDKFGNAIIAVTTSISIVLIIVIGVYTRLKKGRSKRDENQDHCSSEAAEEFEISIGLRFDFSTIKVATSNFSKKNIVQQGMLCPVYKGKICNGQNVAVKKFDLSDPRHRGYYKNAVKLASKIQHRNVVKLLGICSQGSERFLVFEFVSTNLDLLLFDRLKTNDAHLSWDKRYNIIKGIARGLLYLHEDSGLEIVHCDIRASKIFLDEELNPKISGFGRASIFGTSNFQPEHFCSNGYTAPEFISGGLVSDKIDVYSFGVLLLEIVTGRRNGFANVNSHSSLISRIWKNIWREETSLDLVIPEVNNGFESEMKRCIDIGMLCVQENKDTRPTMSVVVQMLNCHCFSIHIPSPHRYLCERSSGLNGSSSNYNTQGRP